MMLLGVFVSVVASASGLRAQSDAAWAEAGKESAVVHRIADPSSGTWWTLLRDPDHPAGPGRLSVSKDRAQPGRLDGHPVEAPHPVIRPGDRLIAEDRLPNGDAWLEAVALDRAVEGATLRARLKMNGKIVRVVAVGPGHVRMPRESGVPG